MKYSKFVFPVTYSLNMFSITAIIVLLGLLGRSEMAADAAIVHAATLVGFMAFSGNARNIILSKDKVLTTNKLLKFRLILVVPLSFVAYFLCYGVLSPESSIVNALILRRALEWILELQISERELHNDIHYAKKYSLIQGLLVTALSFFILIDNIRVFNIILNIWAFSPIIFIYGFIKNGFFVNSDYIAVWKRILPHLGSSWIIACSAYIFRLLIILLAGKVIAGVLFSAYAIGGMVNSIYTYAIGPSIARMLKDGGLKNEKKYTFIIVFLLAIIGGLFVAYAFFTSQISIGGQNGYYFPIGMSLIGGAIMIMAQRQRIHILQLDKSSVFVPDVIINVLIISSVPFSFYLLGQNSLSVLFLWNAALTFFFYKIPSINSDWVRNKFSENKAKKLIAVFDRSFIQAIVIFFLIFPVFFQLDGSLLFHSKEFVFSHGGDLSKLPLPYSLLACLLGLVLLMHKNKGDLESGVLFVFFILMMFSVYITSFNSQDDLLNKIIFLIQFILPVFGLILGGTYVAPKNLLLTYQNIFLIVMPLVISIQLIATITYGFGLLVSDLYVFSIYQHLQYVPIILVGIYGMLTINNEFQAKYKVLFFSLLPLVWVYAIFSASTTSILLLILISFYMLYVLFFSGKSKRLYRFCILLACFFMLFLIKDFVLEFFAFEGGATKDPYFIQKTLLHENGVFSNVTDRLDIWKIYLQGIFESDKTFWFGHSERMSKDVATSAHNYYLDLVYHFGMISLLPLLYLISYTIFKIFKKDGLSTEIIGLSLFVLFLLLIDNSLKVGLRQPYPGILTFFLWGVLLSKVNDKNYLSGQ